VTEDFVRARGYLTLGSRLKRIGERLQADCQMIFKAGGVELPSALMPTLRTVARDGEITIGGLAESLGIAQPGVTRNIAQLEAAGLVRTLKPGGDKRVRTIALTSKGEELVAHTIRELDPRVIRAVAEICDSLEGPFLDQLAKLEDELNDKPLQHRGLEVLETGK
jgi:DNA-binding MarR family transcriptional regulator